MALEKVKVVDQITVLEDGQMQIREVTRIMEDGKELSHLFHRRVIAPDSDTSGEEKKIKDIAKVVHTKEVKDKYKEKELNNG